MQEVPEIVAPKKKQKEHGEKKEAKENEDANGVEGSDDKDATKEQTKGGPDISMADAENAGDDDGGEFTADGALRDEHNIEDEEEEQPAADVLDSTTDKVDAEVEESKDATADMAGAEVESKDWDNDVKIEESKGEGYAEKELFDGKVDSAEAAAADNDESKDNQEKPRMTILEQGTGGNNKISSS